MFFFCLIILELLLHSISGKAKPTFETFYKSFSLNGRVIPLPALSSESNL